MTEPLHIELGERLEDLLIVTGRVADAEKVANVVRIARQVLKNEWAVAKYGIFAPIVVPAKVKWRNYWRQASESTSS
jgi:hypothetical protein